VSVTTANESIVVLIRAWRESDTVRGRLLYDIADDAEVSVVAGSVDELCRLACMTLEIWAATR
jgi:hypothetical protein